MFTSDLHCETGLHTRENRFLFPSVIWKQEKSSAKGEQEVVGFMEDKGRKQ